MQEEIHLIFVFHKKKPCEDLAKCCESLFELLDNFAENNKRRAAVWPLEIMLLVLSPVRKVYIYINYYSI